MQIKGFTKDISPIFKAYIQCKMILNSELRTIFYKNCCAKSYTCFADLSHEYFLI